jgi:prophage regulatory protein
VIVQNKVRDLSVEWEDDMGGVTARVNGTLRKERHGRCVPSGSMTATAPTGVVAAPVVQVKLLRFPDVHERTGLSRSTIWRMERRGEFPKHHRIAPNVVAWSEQEISRWIEQRVGADGSGDRELALAGAVHLVGRNG